MKRTFAVLAVAFLLLRPVCDVLAAAIPHPEPAGPAQAEQHQDGCDGAADGAKVPCCADVDDGALAKASERAGALGDPGADAAPIVSNLVAATHSGSPATGARDAFVFPRTPASFYARSARIRR